MSLPFLLSLQLCHEPCFVLKSLDIIVGLFSESSASKSVGVQGLLSPFTFLVGPYPEMNFTGLDEVLILIAVDSILSLNHELERKWPISLLTRTVVPSPSVEILS